MTLSLRGPDIVARSLKRLGCTRVFTLSGNHIMSIFDAAIEAGLDLVHVRHEAAAVHMADAYGRLTGQPGIALVTGGPGHANAVGALFTALRAEAATVPLSGHAATGAPAVIMESPRGILDATLGAFPDLIVRADLIVLLGKALDFTTKWASGPGFDPAVRIIAIDPDPALVERARKEKGSRLAIG